MDSDRLLTMNDDIPPEYPTKSPFLVLLNLSLKPHHHISTKTARLLRTEKQSRARLNLGEMGEENREKGEEMDWYVGIPKIELHAHLNGSARDSTLLELAKELGEKGVIVFSDVEHVILKNDRCLPECFKLFDLIRILTTDHKTVTRITKEVVEDFAAENVVYLELRTTPKSSTNLHLKNEAIGMSKRSYMEAVLDGLRAVDTVDVSFIPSNGNTESPLELSSRKVKCEGKGGKKIYVRLLLSIDRRETTASAIETVPNQKEVQSMLEFCPQRIGHAICFEDEEWRRLKSSRIPCETYTIDLYKAKHPLVLCTDDPGVFSTSLSQEYKLAALTFVGGVRSAIGTVRRAVEPEIIAAVVVYDYGNKVAHRVDCPQHPGGKPAHESCPFVAIAFGKENCHSPLLAGPATALESI
ncbi:hypothetical protein ACLOJK_029590 [Asimina triloba]